MRQGLSAKSSHRFGLPLVCAKADYIHSLQGVSIGDTKPIKRVVIHWSQQAESMWAGILYVAASRAMESHNVALAFNVTHGDLAKIGTGEKWLKQDAETRRLVGLASSFRLEMGMLREEEWHEHDDCRWGSAYDFKKKLLRFIESAEAACHPPVDAPVPVPVAPSLRPPCLADAPPEVKASVLGCVAQWRAARCLLLALCPPSETKPRGILT